MKLKQVTEMMETNQVPGILSSLKVGKFSDFWAGRLTLGRVKPHASLVGTLVAVVCFLVACQQPTYSHRIFFRNGDGNVIAIAQIALPEPSFFQTDSFTGKWMLESWKDEFPKQGASAEDYKATRKGTELWINFNPTWFDNNVVLRGKEVGSAFKGTWYYASRGPEGGGDFEIVPISSPEARLVARPEASGNRGLSPIITRLLLFPII
jgi:hypothetical protein